MHTTLSLRSLLLSVVATSAFAVTAVAEQPDPDSMRADVLFKQAVAMEKQSSTSFTRHLRRTARLYLESAELRDDSDPLKSQSLHRAGSLLVASDLGRSCRLMGRAAELALARGDVLRATHQFLDAAWVVSHAPSKTNADRRIARNYLEQARLLAESPVLSVQERAGIQKRIESPTLARGL
jgi:hypothetical protein